MSSFPRIVHRLVIAVVLPLLAAPLPVSGAAAENGYAPIGHAFTSTMSDGYGVAYKGIVIDARQGVNGELVSIALARPERFLYQLGSFPTKPSRWPWRSREETGEFDRPTGFTLHGKETVGGVVQLDARVITNVVVHSVAQSLLEEIAPGAASEETTS